MLQVRFTQMVTDRLQRVLLIVLALIAAPIGGWAYLAPHSWYENFPGLGMRWLPPLGPYNEHFCSDVGSTYLGLMVLALVAAVHVTSTGAVRVAAATWLTFSIFHLIYHLRMLHVYNARDAALNMVALTLPALISVVLLIRPHGTVKR